MRSKASKNRNIPIQITALQPSGLSNDGTESEEAENMSQGSPNVESLIFQSNYKHMEEKPPSQSSRKDSPSIPIKEYQLATERHSNLKATLNNPRLQF